MANKEESPMQKSPTIFDALFIWLIFLNQNTDAVNRTPLNINQQVSLFYLLLLQTLRNKGTADGAKSKVFSL